MEENRDVFITDLEMGLETGPAGHPFFPVIHACTARLPNSGFQRIFKQLFIQPLSLPQVTVSLVSCRLIDGGAEIVMRAQRGILDQNVTTHVEFAPGANGTLRVTVTYTRVGIFAASWLLEFVLGAVNRQPGLRQSGPRSIDVDIPTLLQTHEAPVSLRGGVTGVTATSSDLTLMMG